MGNKATFWMPFSGSTMAPEVDAAFYFILYISIFFFLLITIGSIYFVIKYRRKSDAKLQKDTGPSHNSSLEIIWTVIPSIILMICFFWGFKLFMKLTVVPKDALQIRLTAQQWFWTFDYPNGVSVTNELVIPVGKSVGMLMTSRDVLHSFFIPEFRTKYDVIPNRYTQVWFEAVKPGEYQIFCTEYCGLSHSDMLGKVKVLTQPEYESWLVEKANASGGGGMSLVQWGEKLYTEKTCFTCHSKDGSQIIGPTFKGLYGRQEKFLDGSTLKVDENYIRESIVNPTAKVVVGFPPVMPAFQGLLKEREIDALIEYIKTLK